MPLQKLCPAEEFITNYLISWFPHEKEIDETMSNPLHPEHFKGPELDQSLFIKLSSIFWNWLVSANAVELNCLFKMKVYFSWLSRASPVRFCFSNAGQEEKQGVGCSFQEPSDASPRKTRSWSGHNQGVRPRRSAGFATCHACLDTSFAFHSINLGKWLT